MAAYSIGACALRKVTESELKGVDLLHRVGAIKAFGVDGAHRAESAAPAAGQTAQWKGGRASERWKKKKKPTDVQKAVKDA